jgi:hypothetical protein
VWAPVDGATGYRVEVEVGNATPTGMAWTPWRREDVAAPTLAFDFVGDQPGRWRVTALDDSGVHARS